ncbi:NAD(+) diphosphatase [Agaribacterium haliotis]|uniref:NAD(+) diphosphatase n=1 Tax=Agaribacterium haliotis TaxID=2013869 RepID=UPI000BB58438|nr:NAD(+) diphosphatase [Agaribacterium haliotis]
MTPYMLPEQAWLSSGAELCLLVHTEGIAFHPASRQFLLPAASAAKAIERELAQAQALCLIAYRGDESLVLLPAEHSDLPEGWQWLDLRSALALLNEEDGAIAGRAVQLKHWMDTSRYCGRCSSPTQAHQRERAYQCPECGFMQFPQFAPCVIGVVVDGDRVLLANGVKHKAGIYAALAGFIEAGETAEQAFVREVKEEVGVDICNLVYLGSQPWPFPGQLMLGFIADYAGGELNIDENEIVDAGWYSKHNLPQLPPEHTISRQLIDYALERLN